MGMMENARFNEAFYDCQISGQLPINTGKETDDYTWQDAYEYAVCMAARPTLTITEDDIKTLHHKLARLSPEYRPGDYRTGSISMRMYDYDFPPLCDIPARMVQFCNEINTAIITESTPIVAGRCHRLFVDIHPFFGYNGRVARLLMNAILLHGGYRSLFLTGDWREEYEQALHTDRCGITVGAFESLIVRKVQENER